MEKMPSLLTGDMNIAGAVYVFCVCFIETNRDPEACSEYYTDKRKEKPDWMALNVAKHTDTESCNF